MTSVLEHRFGSGDPYTLGVEEEYMLLHPATWDLVPDIDSLLAAAKGGPYESQITAELMQSVLEIATPVCRNVGEAREHLVALRSYVAQLARDQGCRFGSAGTHPLSLIHI